MTSQALASLTATYTDSEGEEDMDDNETPEESKRELVAESPGAGGGSAERTSRPARLVSYVDDTVVSDEEGRDDARRMSMETDAKAETETRETSAEDGMIPPEPAGRCPRELQELIAKYHHRVKHEGLDMNKLIQDKKNFRNPSIYEKLIQFCDIKELDTNYPPDLYDPLRWGKESYHEELAKAQKTEMDRREKEKKEKIALFQGNMGKKVESDEEKKRKSKWDQAAPNVAAKPSIKQPGLLQQPLTTNVTGTKSTVISAFGAIAKPRV